MAGGLPVPVTAAAGRPGSSRRGREEHPPPAAAAAAPRRAPSGALRASGRLATSPSPCAEMGPFRVVPGQLRHGEAGVWDPAGAAARLPAPPRRAAAMAGT